MARYYYEKYTIDYYEYVGTEYTNIQTIYLATVYPKYTINYPNITVSGQPYEISKDNFVEHKIGYTQRTETSLNYYKQLEIDGEGVRCQEGITTVERKKRKGALVEIIIAEDGTYPDNGVQGDYWYVKGERVFPEMYVKIDGIQKVAEDGWVKIDGVLRPIEGIWTKIDGQLKQS